MTAATAPATLCVGVVPLQQSDERGQAAQWAVGAWAEGGNVPGVTVELTAAPVGTGAASFSFGCGTSDGASSCALGTVDSSSAQRLFQAQVAVPLTLTTVTAVSLTVTATAPNLPTDPHATASVAVSAVASPTPAPTAASSSVASLSPSLSPPLSPLPLPSFATPATPATPASTLSPGGNASGLLPTIALSSGASRSGAARQAASTTTLSGAASHLGADAVGLIALGLALVLAVTRISLRRPPRPAPVGKKAPEPSGPPGDTAQAAEDGPDPKDQAS